MSYVNEIKKRIDSDNNAMKASFSDLLCIVSNKKTKVLKGKREDDLDFAVNEIFSYLGIKAKTEIPSDIEGLDERLEFVLRPTGISRRRVELTDGWWKDCSGVLLGSTKDGEAVALMPGFLSGYRFYDKESGKHVKVNKKTFKKLDCQAFCFYRSLPAKKLNLMDLFKFTVKSITQTDFSLILGVSLLVSLLGMFTPFVNKQIFDSVIPSGNKTNVFPVAGLLLGAAVGTSLFGVTRSLILGRLRDKINLSVLSASMARMFSLPAEFFKDYSAGEISSRVMSINSISSLLSDTVLSSGLTFLFSFVYIFQMSAFAPSLVVPGMLIILCMFAFTVLSGFIQQKQFEKQTKISAKMSGLVFGLFRGIQKVKLSGAEKRAFAKWAGSYKEQGRLIYSPPVFLRLNNAVSRVLTFGGTIVLYCFAAENQVSVSDYIAFNVAYGAVSGAIMSLAGIVMSLAQVKPLLEMVKPILNAIPEIDENKKQVTKLSGDIEMSNITFRYSKEGAAVLDNISLKIRPDEYVGIVGRSGSGKTTLMRLLLGFEKPETGAVYYDGEDIQTLDVRSVRQCIGSCLQNGKLFSGDIFSNIIVTAPWSTLDDAWQAAKMAGIDEEIKAMPMGMHTMISEGSGSISGGQRQRILIARALVAKPQIVFFDEATSALDNVTQRIVADSLDSIGCTRLVIAHRLSTVINCDRIIVLDKGKIAEEGSYKELIEKRGLFYDLAIRQIT